MESDTAALHRGADCLLWGQEEIVSVNAVDYARVSKVVCGKKATLSNRTANHGKRPTVFRDERRLLKTSDLHEFREHWK